MSSSRVTAETIEGRCAAEAARHGLCNKYTVYWFYLSPSVSCDLTETPGRVVLRI